MMTLRMMKMMTTVIITKMISWNPVKHTERTPKRTKILGEKFLADKNASGKASNAPPTVPKKAIKSVSKIAQITSLCRHILLPQKSFQMPEMLERM